MEGERGMRSADGRVLYTSLPPNSRPQGCWLLAAACPTPCKPPPNRAALFGWICVNPALTLACPENTASLWLLLSLALPYWPESAYCTIPAQHSPAPFFHLCASEKNRTGLEIPVALSKRIPACDPSLV